MNPATRLTAIAREDGWPLTLQRAFLVAFLHLRNRPIAARLRAPNFHCGRAPRLLGLAHMQIGRNFHAGDALWLHAISAYAGLTYTPQLVIGDDVTFSDSVHIGCLQHISIGSGTQFGSRILVIDHAHGLYRGPQQTSPEIPPALRPLHSAAPITIGRNVWIGDGVAILPGASIGDGAIIGANSVVTGTIPAQTIALGAPARPVRRWNPETSEWQSLPPL